MGAKKIIKIFFLLKFTLLVSISHGKRLHHFAIDLMSTELFLNDLCASIYSQESHECSSASSLGFLLLN